MEVGMEVRNGLVLKRAKKEGLRTGKGAIANFETERTDTENSVNF
jgi:hypothetical protein